MLAAGEQHQKFDVWEKCEECAGFFRNLFFFCMSANIMCIRTHFSMKMIDKSIAKYNIDVKRHVVSS